MGLILGVTTRVVLFVLSFFRSSKKDATAITHAAERKPNV